MPAWYELSVTDEETLAQPCPKCRQPSGVMCVYLTEVRSHTMWGEQRYHLGSGKPVEGHKPGETATRTHRQRKDLARRAKARQLTAARRRTADLTRLTRYRADRRSRLYNPAIEGSWLGRNRAVVIALRAFDRQEYEQVRDWLRAYGEILWQPPEGDDDRSA